MSLQILLLCIAALTVTGLAAYALVLWSRLHRRGSQPVPQAPAKTAERRQRHIDINASITLLAQAMLQDQVSKTEAAIRISTLARGLGADRDHRRYQAFDELAQATAHIPTLEHWQALSTDDKNRYDAERKALEATHSASVLNAARQITNEPRVP